MEQSNWASLLPAKPTEGVRGTAGAYSATRRFLAIGRLPVAAQQFLAPLAAVVMDEARRGPAADGSPAKKKEYTGREEQEVISTKLATTVKLGQYFGLQSVLVQYRAAAQPGKTTADLIGHSKEAISVFSPAEAKTMKVPVEYMVAKTARWALGQPKTHLWPALQAWPKFIEMRVEELQQAHLSIDLPVLPVDICKMVDALWYHFDTQTTNLIITVQTVHKMATEVFAEAWNLGIINIGKPQDLAGKVFLQFMMQMAATAGK